MKRECRLYNSTGDEFGLREITGYDWDSDDDTALSVSTVQGYECANVTACARRIVEQGDNIEGLRMVANDYENLGELANQAHEKLHQWSELYQQIARSEDQAARENGYGAIAN